MHTSKKIMKDRLEKAKDLAQIVSLVAVPLLVAIFGWGIQSAVKEREISRDYVQIAVGILNSPASGSELREWATAVLQQNSPTPFGEAAVRQLSAGAPFIAARVPAPVEDAMEDRGPPKFNMELIVQVRSWNERMRKLDHESDAGLIAAEALEINKEMLDAYQGVATEADRLNIYLGYMQSWAKTIIEHTGTIPGTEGKRIEVE